MIDWRVGRRLLAAIAAAVFLCMAFPCVSVPAHAQQLDEAPDTVVVANKTPQASSGGRATYRGTIADYTNDELTLILPGGGRRLKREERREKREERRERIEDRG